MYLASRSGGGVALESLQGQQKYLQHLYREWENLYAFFMKIVDASFMPWYRCDMLNAGALSICNGNANAAATESGLESCDSRPFRLFYNQDEM
jgi:hypothetical protein